MRRWGKEAGSSRARGGQCATLAKLGSTCVSAYLPYSAHAGGASSGEVITHDIAAHANEQHAHAHAPTRVWHQVNLQRPL